MYRQRFSQFFVCILMLIPVIVLIRAAPQIKKQHAKLPSFVKVCRRSDPNLNACARRSLNSLRKQLVMGIPELFIPPIEPLIIPEIKLDQDSGAIYLHSTYKNIEINGLSNFTLTDLSLDTNKMRLALTMTFPKLSMNALYAMKGKIMLMPLIGEGECKANFTDVELNTVINARRVKKHDRTFIKVKDIKVTYNLGNAKITLDNLFNGDNTLGDRMNLFLNENWEALSEEVRPMMENAMAEVMRSSTDQLFEIYSFDDLLPE